MTNLERGIEVIGEAIHDYMGLSSSNPKEKIEIDNVNQLLENASKGFVLVEFPESQEYMECDWFEEESVLCNDRKLLKRKEYAAYFIPIARILG